MAAQTGLAVKTVQDIEKGRKNPTYETLARLMERLGVSPDA
ncbi:helix-turn-helix domain-containing protein, partial [uncultured Oscillibacter sp.]